METDSWTVVLLLIDKYAKNWQIMQIGIKHGKGLWQMMLTLISSSKETVFLCLQRWSQIRYVYVFDFLHSRNPFPMSEESDLMRRVRWMIINSAKGSAVTEKRRSWHRRSLSGSWASPQRWFQSGRTARQSRRQKGFLHFPNANKYIRIGTYQ